MTPPYLFTSNVGGGAFGNKHKAYHEDYAKVSNYITPTQQPGNPSMGFTDEIINELIRVMKKINIYIWCSKAQLLWLMQRFESCNMELLTWHKSNPIPACKNKYLSDTEYLLFFREKGVEVLGSYETKKKYYVTPINKADKDMYHHPTIKPLEITKNLIINSSKPGDTILDCFMGSGTTCVSAAINKRRYIGIELNETYYNIAKSRIQNINEL